jgi:replicative DNA helicase Mcm
VAYDASTGTFDIDKVVTGISKGRRDLIRTIKEVIGQLADESGRAQKEAVIGQITRQGHHRDEIERLIDLLLRQGEVMEPHRGTIKLI